MGDPGYELKKELKQLLKESDISQREIARKFGISDSTLSQLLNRKSGTELKYLCEMASIAGKELKLVSSNESNEFETLNEAEDLTMNDMFMILTKEIVKIETKVEACLEEINQLKKALGQATKHLMAK